MTAPNDTRELVQVLTKIAKSIDRLRTTTEPHDGGWPASSDPYYDLIVDAAHAWFSKYTNEFAFDQKADEAGVPTMIDPIKIRLGAWAPPEGSEQVLFGRLRHRVTLKAGQPCFYLACLGFDLLVTDSGPTIKRYEKGFLCCKLDPFPVFEWYLQRTAHTVEDADMELVARWSAAEGFEWLGVDAAGARVALLTLAVSGARFHVPITEGGPAPGPTPPAPSSGAPAYLAAGPGSDLQAHLQGDENLVLYHVDPATGALHDPVWDIASMRAQLADHEARIAKLERPHRP